MTNDQLRAFVAVVENGSFRSAAEHMYKTQPTVSAAVQALEHQFNFQLFNRDAYRPKLTAEGKVFYRQAKKILVQAKQLEKLGYQLSQGVSPSLSICMSVICANVIILNRIKIFCAEFPDLMINISGEHLHGVSDQLELEKADLAIGPRYGLGDQHEFVELGQIETVTVAAPNYIDAKETIIRHKELYQYPHILIDNPNVKSKPEESYINVLDAGKRWFVNDYQMKKELLIAGMGWARMPKHMIESELAGGQLITLDVENFHSQSQVPVYLIRLRQQPMSMVVESFWKVMTG
jgi:DNA-binding transcriptional LysR family regulator